MEIWGETKMWLPPRSLYILSDTRWHFCCVWITAFSFAVFFLPLEFYYIISPVQRSCHYWTFPLTIWILRVSCSRKTVAWHLSISTKVQVNLQAHNIEFYLEEVFIKFLWTGLYVTMSWMPCIVWILLFSISFASIKMHRALNIF